jgi:hypothetical protein
VGSTRACYEVGAAASDPRWIVLANHNDSFHFGRKLATNHSEYLVLCRLLVGKSENPNHFWTVDYARRILTTSPDRSIGHNISLRNDDNGRA